MDNPFTLSFGKKPLQYISRISQTAEIIDNFTARQPSNQIYMLTGNWNTCVGMCRLKY